jgi:hypothetical protein
MRELNKKNVFLNVFLFFWAITFLGNAAEAQNNDGITGSMTKEQYQQKFSQLNEVQNDVWNTKFNFKPETNVKAVDNWDDFKKAFEDDSVSKIVMNKSIKSTSNNQALVRKESLELDGQDFTLEMVNGSLNFDDLTNIASFTRRFSDAPVFHMHDIQIINNTGYGAVEGNLGTAWAFINGRGQFGPGGAGGGRRGLWNYRIGNIHTPYDTSKATDNQRVGGRLINGELGEISIWGYNKVVTGAENFYTGGVTYEPSTYYRGEIADYNYSTIWFMLSPAQLGNTNVNKANLTGTQAFDIGADSFVYIHNTNTGTGFPAIYEHYQLLRVGENATYNANVPGTALSFNEDNAQFVAEKGSKVNLLSRSRNAPTISMVNSNATHNTGSNIPPSNTSVTVKEDAEFYVVGNTTLTSGVINPGNRDGKVYLNNIKSFDIRNQANSYFLGSGTVNNLFEINNSDISLWGNASNVDGLADIEAYNVVDFSVIPNTTSGTISSTDSKLLNGYKRNSFKRISGFNSKPELIWTPVTDADLTQKGQVLLGYVPIGGDNPFDENGDAKVQPVYADGNRKVQNDLKDTHQNNYTAISENDNFFYWRPQDHLKNLFQVAGDDLSGKPFRLDDQNIRYREGDAVSTTVIDVTPPEPTKVDQTLTNVTKKLTGTGEVGSKVSVTINDVQKPDLSTTINSQGEWEIQIPSGLLKVNDKVQIFLQDNAPLISSDKNYADENKLPYLPKERIPATNYVNGNINPKTDLKYSDTTFKAATVLIVKDITPETPKINKFARALTEDELGNQIPQSDGTPITPNDWQGKITKVNNTLSYRVSVEIPGTVGEEQQKILYNSKITDTIPNNLKFDKKDVRVWKYKNSDSVTKGPIRHLDDVIDSDGKHKFNMGDIDIEASEATEVSNPIIEYDESTRELTVGIGDTSKSSTEYGYTDANKYGQLLPGEKIVIEFPTIVTPEAVKSTIVNKAKISGYSAEIIVEDPLEYKEISAISNNAQNPGGDVIGELLLTSTPTEISFPTTKLIDYNQTLSADNTNIDKPLIVKDTLRDRNWKVTIKLIEEMSVKENNIVVGELPNSLILRYKDVDQILTLNKAVTVYESDISKGKEIYNISDNWSNKPNEDGLKLKPTTIPQTGTYNGTIEWALENTQ